MTTLFQNAQGLEMKEFLRQYGDRIKQKHVLYAVSTNLAEDKQIRRTTRSRRGGVNIKIGKASSDAYSVIQRYTRMGSNYSPQFPQSGVRVLMVRIYPKRKDTETGTALVNVAETLLKRELNAMDRLVPFRGSEIFNIDPEELFELIESIDLKDYDYSERRASERLGKRLLWMITDTETGKQTLMYAKDYDEVLRKFAEENDPTLLDDRSKYITRYFIKPVTRPQPAFASVSLSGQADEPTRAEPTVQQATQVESSPLVSRRRRRDEMDDATTARIRPWQVPRLVEPEPTRPVYRPPPVYVRPPPRFHETGDRAFPWEPSPRAPPGPPPASWIRELTRRGTKRPPETTPDTTPSKKVFNFPPLV